MIELTSRGDRCRLRGTGHRRCGRTGRGAAGAGDRRLTPGGTGDLFFGIAGEHNDGGAFAQRAIEDGAWGVVVAPNMETAWRPPAAAPM